MWGILAYHNSASIKLVLFYFLLHSHFHQASYCSGWNLSKIYPSTGKSMAHWKRVLTPKYQNSRISGDFYFITSSTIRSIRLFLQLTIQDWVLSWWVGVTHDLLWFILKSQEFITLAIGLLYWKINLSRYSIYTEIGDFHKWTWFSFPMCHSFILPRGNVFRCFSQKKKTKFCFAI